MDTQSESITDKERDRGGERDRLCLHKGNYRKFKYQRDT